MAIASLDLTFPTPAENLACDEALLDGCETSANRSAGVLRFWEALQPFVVLGYANHVGQEVNIEPCRARGVPILRRCSGGGTVLQGPGCLNYSVIVPFDTDPGLASISGTNRFVMERNRDALAKLLRQTVSIEGHTDLTLRGLKFSGNAQRRRRDWLLFHGTILLTGFDLGLVEEILPAPPRQPAYRQRRRHSDFLTCLPLAADAVKDALTQAWQATTQSTELPRPRIDQLVAGRYQNDHWNLKW